MGSQDQYGDGDGGDEKLDRADGDVADIQMKMDAVQSMTGKQIQMDFTQMTVDDLADHCEDTWDAIEEGTEVQKGHKKAQEKVVGHLVETNEWLFAALQETLNDNL